VRTTGEAEPVLECRGLVRRFGDRTAVDDVSFTVGPGETYGLLGPNGAGKSTTIKLVCGLLAAHGGTVHVAGQRVDERATHAKAAIGYVPQDIALYPDLTAAENLRFFGSLYDLRGAALGQRVDEVLELIGLADRAGDRADSFSGGMKRRLNIGAALLHEPRLLVLDEPTVGVDPQSRHAILESVARLGGAGIAVLYTTHYMEEAQRLCDRVGIIDRGRLVAEGTHRELVSLVQEQDRIVLGATGDLTVLAEQLRALAGVVGATAADGSVEVLAGDARRLLPRVLEAADAAGAAVTSVEVVEPDLEAVFLHLTGSALRE
jgi:ABC-2 type transport system ATP-binding protein